MDEQASKVCFFIMDQSEKTPPEQKLKHLGDLFSVNVRKRKRYKCTFCKSVCEN